MDEQHFYWCYLQCGCESSPPVFSGVCVTWSLVLCVCFVDRCLFFCTFSFGHCAVCSSLIFWFWLPLWYHQILLTWTMLSVLLWYSDSEYPFGIIKFFLHEQCCLFFFDILILITPLVSSNSSYMNNVVCSSLMFWFGLPLWYLQILLTWTNEQHFTQNAK